MKKMENAMTTPIINKLNAVLGAIVAVCSYVLGEQWYLFLGFLGFNIADFITRWIAARLTGTENSRKGMIGILKKLGYWIMIAVSFGMSAIFIELGKVIGVNLQVTSLLGWFVLGALIINEIRSILENLVDAGYHPPKILVKGLETANKIINPEDDDQNEKEKK